MGPDKVMEGVAIGQILDPEGRLIGLLQAISWSESNEAMPTISPAAPWFDTEAEDAADLYGCRSPDLDDR
jgi:hypothetical protein